MCVRPEIEARVVVLLEMGVGGCGSGGEAEWHDRLPSLGQRRQRPTRRRAGAGRQLRRTLGRHCECVCLVDETGKAGRCV